MYYANFEANNSICLFEALTDKNRDRLIRAIIKAAELISPKGAIYHWAVWDDESNVIAEGEGCKTNNRIV